MSITINKKKVIAIFDLIFMGLYLFFAIKEFREGSWTWGLLFTVLTLVTVYGVYKHWPWNPPKGDEPDDNDKTKDLKKAWQDKL